MINHFNYSNILSHKNKWTSRIIIGILGVYLVSLGVALSIRSDLGATPISSVPYVLNLIIPKISVGTFSASINIFFVLLQLLILGRGFGIPHLIQIPVALVLSVGVDLNLSLLSGVIPTHYLGGLSLVLLGVLSTGTGVFLQLKANVGVLPAEGIVKTVVDKWGLNFGKTKVAFDSSQVLISIVLGLTLLGRLEAVREGTLIAALMVGLVIEFLNKNFTVINKWVGLEAEPEARLEPYMQTDNYVITISRQYGSGGHAIGEKVAQKLGVPFYDSELIQLTAEASGLATEYVEKYEQALPNHLLYRLYHQNFAYDNEAMPPSDLLFMIQTKVIRQLAVDHSCVIVGRAADFILKGHPNALNVFVHASHEARRKRVIEEYGIPEENSERMLHLKDRQRKNYSKYYTGRVWDDLSFYDLTLDTSNTSIDKVANMVIQAADNREII